MNSFKHLCLFAGALLISTLAGAQTDTARTRTNDQGTNTQNMDPQRGWVMFNDNMGREMNFTADELRRLREVDTRYASEYRSLGTNPTTHTDYWTLTRRRNNDIRGIISNDAYTRWEKRYGNVPPATGTPSAPTAPQNKPK